MLDLCSLSIKRLATADGRSSPSPASDIRLLPFGHIISQFTGKNKTPNAWGRVPSPGRLPPTFIVKPDVGGKAIRLARPASTGALQKPFLIVASTRSRSESACILTTTTLLPYWCRYAQQRPNDGSRFGLSLV